MKHLSARIPAIPSNIGHRIGSIFLPSPDTHLAAGALRSVGRGIARASRQVARAFNPRPAPVVPAMAPAHTDPINAFHAFAQLGMAPPDLDGLHPSNRIESGEELATNLQNTNQEELVKLGQSLERLIQLSRVLGQQLDEHRISVDQDDPVASILQLARDIWSKSQNTHHGYSTHLSLWMKRLVELGNHLPRTIQSGSQLRFEDTNEEKQFDRTQSPDTVATRSTTRTLSKAISAGGKKVHTQKKQTAARSLPTAPSIAAEPADMSAPEPEKEIDFNSIVAFMGDNADAFIKGFLETLQPIAERIVEQETLVAQHGAGSVVWCRAMVNTVDALDAASEMLRLHGHHYLENGGDDPALAHWFATRSRDLTQRANNWMKVADPYSDRFNALGFAIG